MNTGGIVPPMQQKTPAQGVSFQSDPLMRSQFKGYMSGLADKSMQNVMKIRDDFENPGQIPFFMHFASFWLNF